MYYTVDVLFCPALGYNLRSRRRRVARIVVGIKASMGRDGGSRYCGQTDYLDRMTAIELEYVSKEVFVAAENE